jgi:hypothetical protein
MHSCNILGAWTNHGHTRTHKTHHSSDLGEATTFPPYNIFYALPQGVHSNVILSQDSQVESFEISKIRIPATLEAHNFLCKPLIKVRFKAKL